MEWRLTPERKATLKLLRQGEFPGAVRLLLKEINEEVLEGRGTVEILGDDVTEILYVLSWSPRSGKKKVIIIDGERIEVDPFHIIIRTEGMRSGSYLRITANYSLGEDTEDVNVSPLYIFPDINQIEHILEGEKPIMKASLER